MIRRAITLLAVVCALSSALPVAAGAAASGTPAEAISDCNSHDQLTAHYSTAVLRAALAQMPSDVKEYTDCYDVIEQQLFKQLGKTPPATASAPSSSSSSFLPTWLIIVIVVLALAAITFGAIAFRRRSGGRGGRGGPGSGDPGPSDGPGGPSGSDGPSTPDRPSTPDGPSTPAGPSAPAGPTDPTAPPPPT